jgi:hypothetical protein
LTFEQSQGLLSRFDQKQMLASEGKSLQRPFGMLFRVKIKVASDFQPPRIGVTNQGFWNTSLANSGHFEP